MFALLAFSPLFIGAMVATYGQETCYRQQGNQLSVPFSSGQWLLHLAGGLDSSASLFFQSPFHRGNGCYLNISSAYARRLETFQSPFHRGNGCYASISTTSVPSTSFSPLFIGAMVATVEIHNRQSSNNLLSVPFSSGQWLLQNSPIPCCWHW